MEFFFLAQGLSGPVHLPGRFSIEAMARGSRFSGCCAERGVRSSQKLGVGGACRRGRFLLWQRVVELSRMSADELKGFGENAFAYYQEHFTKEKCMGVLEGVLRGE